MKATRWRQPCCRQADATTAASGRSSSAWRMPTLMSITPTPSGPLANITASPSSEAAAIPIAATKSFRAREGCSGPRGRPWSGVVEHQGSELDALPRQDIGGSGRVVKGGVGGKACRTVFGRIVAFDQDRLVGPHLRHIEPAVSGVVSDAVGLAFPIAVDQIRGDEIRKGDTRRIANGERRVTQRPANRPPYIDDLEAVAQQLLGFLAHQVAHPLRAGLHGIVVVDTGDWLARCAGCAVDAARDAAADRVVEYQHP